MFQLHISYTSGYLRQWTSQRGLLSNTLLGWGESGQDLVWQSVQCKSLSAKYKDFLWRLAAGCLKTGDVISSWNIPGANPTCVCCNDELETVSHMFMSCTALRPARDLLVTSGQQWLGLTINTNNAKEILNGVFC